MNFFSIHKTKHMFYLLCKNISSILFWGSSYKPNLLLEKKCSYSKYSPQFPSRFKHLFKCYLRVKFPKLWIIFSLFFSVSRQPIFFCYVLNVSNKYIHKRKHCWHKRPVSKQLLSDNKVQKVNFDLVWNIHQNIVLFT